MTPATAAGLVLATLLAASVAGNLYQHRALENAQEALGAARSDARQAGAAAGQCHAGVVAVRQEAAARAAAAARRTAAAEGRAHRAEAASQAVLATQAAAGATPCQAAAALNRARLQARRGVPR